MAEGIANLMIQKQADTDVDANDTTIVPTKVC
jgi:hypothetical protein